ncbi:LOW QUALITY PROTEIN: von Willebrand factor A domain-containing protein 5A-like [Malaclemys terrapin pileata]|uniref:LOW QUALITY PROTEIN: von Willebrand factor A domain-containing protein 5A-like n=1 Tax=Malaclemys terrapin pileata TaxID=2991368 RepID=UPI0023A7982B|nr:LOW QUALITY PROTEIN: von Willebrand factor A domain-containing protein 5A-like [Malaclemys terrapin pileata]
MKVKFKRGKVLSIFQPLHLSPEAQELYRDALAGGQTSFLLQQEGAGGDVFSCSLGNLPPGEEAALTLRYACELPLEPDGAARYVLPAGHAAPPLHTPWVGQGGHHPGGPAGTPRELPYTLSLNVTLQSPHGIDRVLSNCSLTPLSYRAGNQTTAQVSLAQAPPWDRDMELLVHYAEPQKPSAVLEAGLPEVEPGSLMGDPAVMVTLLPSLPEALPASSAGEFIFLLDCSGSMGCPMDGLDYSAQRIDSAKETLVLLLKSLPLGCYFNIYGFGSWFESFYLQSVGYTQQTMAESLQRVQQLQADLGGTEILAPLQAIYRSPCLDGHPRQLFVFTDGEVRNTQDVIAEVQRHRGAHRCFSFGIREGASTALVKGIARAAGGSAEFITGQDRMQPKALQSLKQALHPAVTGISLSWDLPPGMEAALLGRGPEVIFPGQRCLIYAQLRGQPQAARSPSGSQVTAAGAGGGRGHRVGGGPALGAGDQPELGGRLLPHGLRGGGHRAGAAGAGAAGETGQPADRLQGCGQNAAHGRYMDPARPWPDVLPVRSAAQCQRPSSGAQNHPFPPPPRAEPGEPTVKGQPQGVLGTRLAGCCGPPERAPEESPLLRLVSLQNADGSWDLDPRLAAALGVSETDARGRMPSRVSAGGERKGRDGEQVL